MADASISIGADATQVERAMAVGVAALRNFASEAKSAIGHAMSSVASSISEVALAQGKVNFVGQHQQVRDFEASTARMAVAVGRDLETVRHEAEATGTAIGKRPAEVMAWTNEVGKLTYSFTGAQAGMKGMAELAALTNRSVQDYRGLAVELQTVGNVAGDTSKMVGVLKMQADNLGVRGGVAAFADQVEALKESFSHFAIKDNFADITALTGKLGEGLGPGAAQRVQQTVFGTLTANPFEWSRYLGRDIFNEKGQLEDPNRTVADIVSKIEHTYGKQGRRALMLQFGVEAGSQLHQLYQSGELFRSPKMGETGGATAAPDALKQYLQTDAGKRESAEVELAKSARDLMGSSSLLGRAADALQRFAAGHPIASTFAATAAGGIVSAGVGAAGKALTTGAGGIATTAARALPLAGMALPVVAAGAAGLYAGWEMAGGQEAVDRAGQDEIARGYSPEQKHELVVAREARDRARAAIGRAPLTGAYVPSADDTKLAQGATTAQGIAAFQARLQKEGISETDAQTIARAVGEAVAKALQGAAVQVNQNPDNPISATLSTSQSSAAGNQSGT